VRKRGSKIGWRKKETEGGGGGRVSVEHIDV